LRTFSLEAAIPRQESREIQTGGKEGERIYSRRVIKLTEYARAYAREGAAQHKQIIAVRFVGLGY
jgi:hypothetical protein